MSLKIKKEKIDNKENTDNEKPKRTRKNNDQAILKPKILKNEIFPKKVRLVKNNAC